MSPIRDGIGSLSETDAEQLGALLNSFVVETHAHCALLCDRSGRLLIKSGDTLAIGGLLQDEVSKAKTKVPVFGDIPLFGYLFQEKVNRLSPSQ